MGLLVSCKVEDIIASLWTWELVVEVVLDLGSAVEDLGVFNGRRVWAADGSSFSG